MMTLSEVEKQKLIRELEEFHDGFIRYKELVMVEKMRPLTSKAEPEFQELSLKLQRKYGSLKEVIEKYGGPAVLLLQGGKVEYEVFSSAFNYTPFSDGALATILKTAISKVNIAIGNLQSLTLPASMATATTLTPPKAFIAHGGESQALTKLKDFLRALGVKPLVVEEQPSEGRQIDEQVDEYFKEADCEIVLATYGEIVDEKTGAKHPRLNVIDELARGRERFPKKVVLLLEKDVELPTNVSGIIYERFTKDNMTDAFIKVARELTAFGLLRATKPSQDKS